MACDAASVQSLVATSGLTKLSDRTLLAVVANLYGLSGVSATTAEATAMANGYARLSDLGLWQCFLAAICTGTCDAKTLDALAASNGYEKLSDRALFEGMVAEAAGGATATALVASEVANGYEKPSERGLLEALVANACSGSCSAASLMATAMANGYDQLGRRELLKCILAVICKNGGVTPITPPGPTLTNFLWVPRSGSGVSSQAIGSWDPPPAGFTGTELWTSADNITYVLAGTVAAPGTNLAFSVAAGTVRWAKARWVGGSTQGSFCAAQEVSGNVCDWARRCIANGALSTSLTTRQALNTMDLAFIAAGIDSQMVYVLPLAPDSLTVAITPLYNVGGNDPATNHGPFVAGDLTVNGLIGDGATKYLDMGINPSTAWPFNGTKDGGYTLYNMTASNSATSVEIGAITAGGAFDLEIDFNDGNSYFPCYGQVSGNNRLQAANTLWTGFISGNRISQSRADLYTANSSTAFSSIGNLTTNLGQQGINGVNTPIAIFANNNTGTVGSFSSRRMSFAAAHNGLTSAQCQALFNAVQAYRVALGGGFV